MPVVRPTQIPSIQMNGNKASFMDAFMQHLHEKQIDAEKEKQIDVKKEKQIDAKTTTPPNILVSGIKPEPKLPKKPRKPRDPSAPKKPRKKKESNCTTIGLQIQIRDPNTEPATTSPLETSFESDIITMYPFKSDDMDATTPTKLISNTVEQYMPLISPNVNESPEKTMTMTTTPTTPTTTTTYYNMDSAGCEPIEQVLYEPETEPEPEPVYHAHKMNMMTSECVSVSNNTNHMSGDCPPSSHQSYNIYSDQKNNQLLSRFNVSHSNANNNAVANSIHNWRPGNEIM